MKMSSLGPFSANQWERASPQNGNHHKWSWLPRLIDWALVCGGVQKGYPPTSPTF